MRKMILFLILAMLQFTAKTHRKNGFDSKSSKMDAAAPAITSFTPASGSVGTLVTIKGTNLGTATVFTIGGTSAIEISNSGSTLVGMVMPGAVTRPISLTTAGGTATSPSNFIIIPTPFPSTQQGNKLVGTGGVGDPGQGYSVSISADGNTAIVGGPSDSSGEGAAWVYTRSGGVWTQQGSKLVGTGGGPVSQFSPGIEQGNSVSISADGNTAIVGGPNDSLNVGAVWVYSRSGGVWTQQGNKLVGTGWVGTYAEQGVSVSISADGNTAIVGGVADNSFVGAAWVYIRIGGVWTQQGSKLVGAGGIGGIDALEQGISVSISADGNTAIVGGPGDSSDVGAAWVYTRSGGTWTQQGNKLVGIGGIGFPRQGISVSVSADGNTAIVGGDEDNGYVGAAWIFTRNIGVWTQQGSKLVGTGGVGDPGQGYSLSISGDGNTAMVGGYSDSSVVGSVWVYTRSGGVWAQQGSKLVGTGGINGINGQFHGTSVSISADGYTTIVGGSSDNSYVGTTWIYIQNVSITWIGGINSDWMTTGNWSGGVVPGINNNVIIPANTPFSPIVFAGTNTSIRDIYLLPGAILTVQTNAKLNVTN